MVIAFAPCSQHLGFFSDPVEGIVPRVLAFDVAGPMARNVADIAFVHTAMVYEAELTAADLRDVRIGVRRAYYWEILDADVAKIMEESLDKLRGAGAVFVDVDFADLAKTALAIGAVLSPEGFRVYLADSLAHEYYGANKAIATLATAKKEPTKFARLVELQQACDAVEWALEDEAAAAREHDSGKS